MTDFKTGHIPDPRDTSFTEDVKKVTEQTIWPEDEMRQRIAELEAENAGLRSHQACTKRAEQAEAELAALKGRRCETCRMAAACDQFINFMGNAVRELDFCSEWAAREDGES